MATTERQWPAAKVEQRAIGELLAYPQNPMVHSDDQVQKIANSITEYGWTTPALIDEAGVLICGHARVRAAQLLGLSHVPVMVARGWTEQQKKSYRIADNQLPRLSEFSPELLRIELNDLKIASYPLELTGFDNLQLVQFMAGVPSGKDPEATPEPPVVPVSKRGDVWVLGNHRLMCGDATSAEDVERLLDGAKIDAVLMDPPYGMNKNFSNDSPDEADALVEQIIQWCRKHVKGNVLSFWSAQRMDAIERLFHPKRIMIWHKTFSIYAPNNVGYRWEPIIWVSGVEATTKRGDVFECFPVAFKSNAESVAHPTQKPSELFKEIISDFMPAGATVYDPFAGSFTAGIACEMTARRHLALEIAPEYIDVGIQRWQEFTGKEAHLDETGKPTYAEIKADRTKPARKRKRAPAAA